MSPRIALLISLALQPMMEPGILSAQDAPRARDLGIPFDGEPGPLNAITDVAGVEVGHVTLIEGEGPPVVGRGPVRTGVTAILPREGRWGHGVRGLVLAQRKRRDDGHGLDRAVRRPGGAGFHHEHPQRGRGQGRGHRLDDGAPPELRPALPVVAETYDGLLNDTNGFHVTAEHAIAALDGADPVPCRKATWAVEPA